MNLYEIANEYQSLMNQTYDPETGEIRLLPEHWMHDVGRRLEEKAIAVASYIKNLEAEREAIEKAKKSMAEREERLERRTDYLTQYLQSNMERCGIAEIRSPWFVIKLKKCPVSTDIIDEDCIPDDYKKTKEVVSIDRARIRDELKAGVIVPGAELRQNNRIEIK